MFCLFQVYGEVIQLYIHIFYMCVYVYIYMLSRLVITFLPRSKHLLTSWLQSPPAVIWEPPKNKV